MSRLIVLALCFALVGCEPKLTPDQLYGCTIQQQAPNGECK